MKKRRSGPYREKFPDYGRRYTAFGLDNNLADVIKNAEYPNSPYKSVKEYFETQETHEARVNIDDNKRMFMAQYLWLSEKEAEDIPTAHFEDMYNVEKAVRINAAEMGTEDINDIERQVDERKAETPDINDDYDNR